MSDIYLNQHGIEVSKDGGRLTIKSKDGQVKYVPLSYADCLIVTASVQITYAAIMAVLANKGSIIYIDNNGDIAGELGQKMGKSRQLVRQLQCYSDVSKRQEIAADIVKKKILAQRNILSVKNKSLHNSAIKSVIGKLSALAKLAEGSKSIEKLMGIEGVAAKAYFDTFAILLSGGAFKWNGRHKRPATDPVNAMLSFGYSMLEKDVRRAIAVAGLASSIGFLHELNYRKDSLVYDLMEVFRPTIIDKLVLRCISLKMFAESDFVISDGKCLFEEDAKKRFIAEYENYVGQDDDDIDMSKRKQIILEAKGLVKKMRDLEAAEIKS